MSTNVTLLDLSTSSDLRYLAALTAAFRAGAGNMPFFLAGATARDLLLFYAHGIDPGRDTRDADFALMVPDWAAFKALRLRLINGGRFAQNGRVAHKFVFDGYLEVDLIPFGAVERTDRTVALPPNGDFVMTVFGFREVFEATLPVRLPEGEEIHIVSLPALAVLKLLAWEERRFIQPGKDAYDLAAILCTYLEAGNHERLYTEAGSLLDAPEFDFEEAGAWLLGSDMAQLLPQSARLPIAEIVKREANPQGPARLAGDMPIDAVRGLRLLKSLTRGFMETTER